MIFMVKSKHNCEVCGKEFEKKEDAEEHEKSHNDIATALKFTHQEKIRRFDILQEKCLKYAQKKIKGEWMDEDDDHYIFSDAMTTTLGDDIFKKLNRK